jgi:hypothetical protein
LSPAQCREASADQAAAVTENLLASTVVRKTAANALISSSLSAP